MVAVGALPTEEAGGRDDDLRRALLELFSGPRAVHVDDAAQAAGAVAAAGGSAATLRPAAADVRVLRLQRGRDRSFIVVNEGDRTVRDDRGLPRLGRARALGSGDRPDGRGGRVA